MGLLAVLAACAPGGTAAKKDLQFWYSFSDANQQKYFQQHFVDDYKGSVPVKLTVKPLETILQLTETALAAGSGPAVILTPTASNQYAAAGYLVDLNDYAKQYGWTEKFASWALEVSKVDGKLVTLPIQYESMAFYFNPAVISDNNLVVPKNQGEFEAFCEEASGKGIIPIAAGNADWKGANEWHVGVALNHGAGSDAVYSALQGETKWTDPVFVDAITRLNDYFQKGWYGGSVNTYFTNQFPKVYQQLASGEAAAMISGTWEFSGLGPYFGEAAGNTAEWDWAPIPSLGDGVPEQVWDLAIGQSLAVNAKGSNIPAAVEYLNFLATDVKTIVASVEDMSFEPPPIHLKDSDFSAKSDERTSRLYSELSAAKTIGYTTWTFFPAKTDNYIVTEFEKVLTKEITPKDYCAGIQSQFATEFAAGEVPTAPKPGAGLA
jgi:raffinose/stachyose/melibiose transport system substrate-binding protein